MTSHVTRSLRALTLAALLLAGPAWAADPKPAAPPKPTIESLTAERDAAVAQVALQKALVAEIRGQRDSEVQALSDQLAIAHVQLLAAAQQQPPAPKDGK